MYVNAKTVPRGWAKNMGFVHREEFKSKSQSIGSVALLCNYRCKLLKATKLLGTALSLPPCLTIGLDYRSKVGNTMNSSQVVSVCCCRPM